MNASWAYNWVQIMAHNKSILSGSWALLSLLALYGLTMVDFTPLLSDLGLLAISLVLMSLTMGYLIDSFKSGLVQLALSLYILLMLFGGMGWIGTPFNTESVLGLVVVVTLLTSNLVHILSTLLREMARGLFQYDAMAEALKSNAMPIFLSNLTTALGFIFAAWFDESLTELAIIVSLGATISFLSAMTWLPLFLLSWLLEFRVGNSADRHGFSFVSKGLMKYRWLRNGLLWLGIGLLVFLTLYNGFYQPQFQDLFWLGVAFFVLFLIFWQSLKLALINVLVNLLALMITLNIFMLFMALGNMSLLLIMVPLGLIVDDGIHFFSRYVRAQQSVFTDAESAVRFSMASVGRPIWISSWVLFIGLAVLAFSHNELVQSASLITLLALIIATFLILLVVPAVLISLQNKQITTID
ncbi:MAG: MMPL family transporter [Thiomicrorhabdus sp.]|jgi:predicted RND superfamily exporter protein|nr:MMPL family transporter [Thiomicrorhabdus sp.]